MVMLVVEKSRIVVDRAKTLHPARRAKSEQQRQRSQVNEVLLDLDAMQRKWLDEDEKKGQELQRRCDDPLENDFPIAFRRVFNWRRNLQLWSTKTKPRKPRLSSSSYVRKD